MLSRRAKAPQGGGTDADDEADLERQLKDIQAKLQERRLKRKAPDTEEAVPSSPRKKQPRYPDSKLHRHVQSYSSSDARPEPVASEPIPSHAVTRVEQRPAASAFSSRMADYRRSDKSATASRAKKQATRKTGFGAGKRKTNSKDSAVSINTEHDPHSKLDLSRRYITASDLDSAMADKAVYRLPRLLREVIGPAYEPPDVDGDYVVMAIIASKSEPRYMPGPSKKEQKKFMVLHLTDLEWEIDLFLFDGAFEEFWKISQGSVVAILNPLVMPPRPHQRDSGMFSLKVCSSDDCIMEMGTAAHLGLCPSIKKDGGKCGSWFDTRKADHCDFHTNLAVERSRVGRMETNSMLGFDLFGRGGGKGRRDDKPKHLSRKVPDPSQPKKQKKPNGFYHDREAHEMAYNMPSMGASTAALLDGGTSSRHDGVSAQERRRRELAARERDRDLSNLLGKGLTNGGSQSHREPLDIGTANRLPLDAAAPSEQDAKSLGLIGKSRGLLKPAGAVTAGWSGANRRGLPEKEQAKPAKVTKPQTQTFFSVSKKQELFSQARTRKTQAAEANDDDDLQIV